MKLAFLLFVVFLGQVLTENQNTAPPRKSVKVSTATKLDATRNGSRPTTPKPVVVHKRYAQVHVVKKRDNTNNENMAKAVIKSIRKEADKKKKLATKLGKQRNSKLLYQAKTGPNTLDKFLKMSVEQFNSLKEKAVASEKITRSSAQMTLELVNTTVTDLRKTLQESALNIKDLLNSFIFKEKTYADSILAKMSDALKDEDVEQAKALLTQELKLILKVSRTCSQKIRESYSTSAKEVMAMANGGAVLLLESADKQTQKFKVVEPDNEKLQAYIDNSSRQIYAIAKKSGDKFIELSLQCLQSLKQLAYRGERSLSLLAFLELDFGKALVLNDVEKRSELKAKIDQTVSKFEDENEKEWTRIIETAMKTAVDMMTEFKNIMHADVNVCSPNDDSCVLRG